jgi:hypothetical protein
MHARGIIMTIAILVIIAGLAAGWLLTRNRNG